MDRARKEGLDGACWLEVDRFPKNRNCEPQFLQRNRFIYFTRTPNELELLCFGNWNRSTSNAWLRIYYSQFRAASSF